MKNFPVTDAKTQQEYWISRSVCVVVLILADCGEDFCILAERRGEGTPDEEFRGSWCLPCGYVDYDETIVEAAAREVYEETGLSISTEKFKLVGIMDNPTQDKRQNISFRYVVNLQEESLEELCEQLNSDHSEENEITQLAFIPYSEIKLYKWAFNHNALIPKMLTAYTIYETEGSNSLVQVD